MATNFELALLSPSDLTDYLVFEGVSSALRETRLLYKTASITLEEIPSGNFCHLFRFEKNDISILYRTLQLPTRFETDDQHVIGGIEGLCLVLRRMSYPNRLKDIQDMFGLHFTSLSKLLTVIIKNIFKKWGIKLLDFGANSWFTRELQEDMAKHVKQKGAPLPNCIGFIDGTARAICRPTFNQQELYSGHKRVHCLKFQSITLPNGIILHLSLPYPGRRHDAFMLRDTKIMEQLRLYCPNFCLYGDEGYPLRHQLMRPFSSTSLTAEQILFNKAMAPLRQCVEWSFGKILQQFAFVDFKKNQKLYLQPVGMYYIVSALLTNAHTCFYGSMTSTYFNFESISINEYFQIQNVNE